MTLGKFTDEELAIERQRNNPSYEPTGHFTGRCALCGSDDLWDDNLAYGCNHCGALLNGNDWPNGRVRLERIQED